MTLYPTCIHCPYALFYWFSSQGWLYWFSHVLCFGVAILCQSLVKPCRILWLIGVSLGLECVLEPLSSPSMGGGSLIGSSWLGGWMPSSIGIFFLDVACVDSWILHVIILQSWFLCSWKEEIVSWWFKIVTMIMYLCNRHLYVIIHEIVIGHDVVT